MLVVENLKAKLYPTWRQIVWLKKQFGNCRFVYNHGLDYCKGIFKHYQKVAEKYGKKRAKKECVYPTLKIINEWLTSLKEANPWLRVSDSRSLQVCYKTLLRTYKHYHRGLCGKPHYKSRKDYKQSYKTSYIQKQPYLIHNKLNVSKMGTIRAHFNKVPLGYRIKQLVITKRPNGRYYATLTVECEKQALPLTGKAVGIDMGLRDEAILSNGIKIPFYDFGKKYEAKRKYWERITSRRLRGAKGRLKQINGYDHKHFPDAYDLTLLNCTNYQKARRIRAHYFQLEKNSRQDFLQKLTTQLVRNYDIIVIENLKSSNMMKNHHSARAIAQASWRKFRSMLTYKCWWYHKKLIVVNPAYTTQTCHDCGYICNYKDKTFIKWGVESWTCPQCHAKHDRDINAAINIKEEGLKELRSSLNTGLERATGKSSVYTSLYTVVRNPTLMSLGYLVRRRSDVPTESSKVPTVRLASDAYDFSRR